ncbi:synaptoporin-like isoform X2 [Tubulanus polymorphus]|uniref:synaptoporin-like isoform X2 n=1 Tax=Tubulanus polymorphus TaxID=672921 RepID=UPI003DA31C73
MIVVIFTLKIICLIIAIFAFATTCGYSGSTEFKVTCNNTETQTRKISFEYPFRINAEEIKVPICGAADKTVHPWGDFKAPAEFYVFVGVMAFLYCIAAVILYVFFDDHYRKNDKIPIADFIVSVVLTVLWLIGSCVWAQGIADIRSYTDPAEVYRLHIPECRGPNPLKCEVTDSGNYAGLFVSIMFGFLNLFVWIGNLWFLFKETAWFKVRQKPAEEPVGVDPSQVQV